MRQPASAFCHALAGAGLPATARSASGALAAWRRRGYRRAPADGYTLLLGAAGPNAILPLVNPKTPYDTLEDFAEVSHFANTVYVIVAHPSLPANSIKDLIALAKNRPGKLTVGVAGVASPAHIAGEFLRAASGIELASVFYKGDASAIVEIIGGQINLGIVTTSPVLPHAKIGKLKVLAVTSAKRSSQLPEVPTVAESGYTGFEVVNWYGVLAPAGTPRRVISRVAADMAKTVKIPEIREHLIAAGLDVVESTPEAYSAFRKRDLEMWAKMIKAGSIRAE